MVLRRPLDSFVGQGSQDPLGEGPAFRPPLPDPTRWTQTLAPDRALAVDVPTRLSLRRQLLGARPASGMGVLPAIPPSLVEQEIELFAREQGGRGASDEAIFALKQGASFVGSFMSPIAAQLEQESAKRHIEYRVEPRTSLPQGGDSRLLRKKVSQDAKERTMSKDMRSGRAVDSGAMRWAQEAGLEPPEDSGGRPYPPISPRGVAVSQSIGAKGPRQGRVEAPAPRRPSGKEPFCVSYDSVDGNTYKVEVGISEGPGSPVTTLPEARIRVVMHALVERAKGGDLKRTLIDLNVKLFDANGQSVFDAELLRQTLSQEEEEGETSQSDLQFYDSRGAQDQG